MYGFLKIPHKYDFLFKQRVQLSQVQHNVLVQKILYQIIHTKSLWIGRQKFMWKDDRIALYQQHIRSLYHAIDAWIKVAGISQLEN